MHTVSTIQPTHESLAVTEHDVVVVGAGPYGLSIAAHLAHKGLNVAIFGKPLELWRDNMPKGMLLRSHWWGTNLSDPQKRYSFAQFFRASEYRACYPVPIEVFIEYGMWFQKHAVPFVDPTYVDSVQRTNGGFVLGLADGRVVKTAAMVLAIGLNYYQRIPAEYTHLPAELLTHSGESGDFSRFAGKRVAVIGGGQAAVEYAALLNEVGASVELIARRPVKWLQPDNDDPRPLIERLRAPNNSISPGWKHWGLEAFPYLFHRLPQERKDGIITNNHHPGASDWLRERVLGKVQLHEGKKVTRIVESAGGVALTLSEQTHVQVDQVMLGTGFEADVRRLTMLDPALMADIKTHLGSPILNPWFESTVPGLYFPGFSALQSFGPLYRFVGGVPATAPRIARAVMRHVGKAR